MSLSLDEIKDLIRFGRAQGLQTMSVEGCAVVYGAPVLELQLTGNEKPPPATDDVVSHLPDELRHYSAIGKAAMGKVAR
jgi:hypothetical protein